MRQQLERPLLGAEVGQAQTRVGVDDRGQRDAGEVVALRHHLRADQRRALGVAECAQRFGNASVLDRVGVEAEARQVGDRGRELAVQPLRARADPRELGGAARRTELGRGLAPAAVMAAERPVAVQDERDVTVLAADRRAARTAVQRRCNAAPVQEQDRLFAARHDLFECLQQRSGERVAGLPP